MSDFVDLYRLIEEKHKEKIAFIKVGIFYVSIGKSAVIMHKIFGLKPICIIEGVCKCVVPIKNMDSYVSKLATLYLGFVIYNKEGFNINEIFSRVLTRVS